MSVRKVTFFINFCADDDLGASRGGSVHDAAPFFFFFFCKCVIADNLGAAALKASQD